MNIRKNNLNLNGISFSGHKKTINESGFDKHDFFYLYDTNKYNCEVEFFSIKKDKNGNYSIKEAANKPAEVVPLAEDSRIGGGKVSVNVRKMFTIESNEGFAYRFKLTEKNNPKKVSYAFDNGAVIGIFDDINNPKNKFNIVLNNRATINKNGSMQLIMPDEYYPGIVKDAKSGKPTLDETMRAQALASVRTHANRLGGNFFGIISRLPEIAKEGVTRIVGTPYTRDTISSHLYWTENAYQVAPNLGTEEDFKQLQIELFKNGINWIADAALVNEGFGGIHLSELLRKGQNSISKDMFRADEKISLHILPDNLGHTKMKIINADFSITSAGEYIPNNSEYNPAKPTYIQFYDDRLASDEQKASQSPSRMTTYDKKNTRNIYDITKHDDAVYPFPIEVNRDELKRNIERLLKTEPKLDFSKLNMSQIKQITDFTNFNIENKSASASGLEVWDGNVDIAKLNFYPSDKDDARFSKLPLEEQQAAMDDFRRGGLAVRDYAVNSGKYWTKLTADTQFAYISSMLASKKSSDVNGYMDVINKLTNNGSMPKSVKDVVDRTVIKNVLSDRYNFRRLDNNDVRSSLYSNDMNPNKYSVSDYIARNSMDLPLETLPVATNLLGILTSPYLAKKANTEEELAVSRFDITEAGNPNLPEKYKGIYTKMDNIYKEQIAPLIEELIEKVPDLEKDDEVTEYGRYVIAEIAPELTKYILLKALNQSAQVNVDDMGNFDFSKVDRESITMQSLNIPYEGMSSKEEAETVINALMSGIGNISDKDKAILKEKIRRRFENRSLTDFKMAEMIMDRTESGLGWRIDAAKDIATIDAVRTTVDGKGTSAESITSAWNKVIDFWKLYNQSVLKVNPHAYTTAEITDLYDLFKGQDRSVFASDGDAERKFLNETGITSIANYSFFFSLLPDLFAPLGLQDGNTWRSDQQMNHDIIDKLVKGWEDGDIPNIPGFLFQSPDDGITNSYTFVGNHDKPRMLHLLALDQKLSHMDFNIDDLNAAIKEKERFNKEIDNKIAAAATDKQKEDLQNSKKSIDNELNAIKEKEHYRDIAYEIYAADRTTRIAPRDKFDFDKVNSMAIAMGVRINQAVEDIINDESKESNVRMALKELQPEIKQAISNLAQGKYMGANFDPEAFGTRPFEVAITSVLNQIDYNKKTSKIDAKTREKIEPVLLESILKPAYDRFYSIYKLLVTLPGSPTDFAGDRVGASGYETKAKNYHQQNRNIIRWEWLKDERYKFIKDAYNTMNDISRLRKNPKLSALNDGATIALQIENESDANRYRYQSFIRYNDKSVVLVITDSTGSNSPANKEMDRNTADRTDGYGKSYETDAKDAEGKDIKITKYTGEIDLTPLFNTDETQPADKRNNAKKGLKHGITAGTKFMNARSEDKSIYTVQVDNNNKYYLERTLDGKKEPIRISKEDLNTLILYKI